MYWNPEDLKLVYVVLNPLSITAGVYKIERFRSFNKVSIFVKILEIKEQNTF